MRSKPRVAQRLRPLRLTQADRSNGRACKAMKNLSTDNFQSAGGCEKPLKAIAFAA